jgi:hypothetical protein
MIVSADHVGIHDTAEFCVSSLHNNNNISFYLTLLKSYYTLHICLFLTVHCKKKNI